MRRRTLALGLFASWGWLGTSLVLDGLPRFAVGGRRRRQDSLIRSTPARPHHRPSLSDSNLCHKDGYPLLISSSKRAVAPAAALASSSNDDESLQRSNNAPPRVPSNSKRRTGIRSRGNFGRTTPSQGASKDGDLESEATTTWRVYGVEVHPDDLAACGEATTTTPTSSTGPDPVSRTEDVSRVPPAVLEALCGRIVRGRSRDGADGNGTRASGDAAADRLLKRVVRDVRVVRHSVDARLHQRRRDGSTGPRHVYVLDVTVDNAPNRAAGSPLRLIHQPGRMERVGRDSDDNQLEQHGTTDESPNDDASQLKPVVVIVGAGPAGLFCALALARSGRAKPIVLERGQPVESRGRDIGALMHRRQLDPDSNYAFGEGGAGTWSDGKLTTRIGRNSGAVRHVLETLVRYGAPASILVEGAPHLGTDNLVRLLRNMRSDLRRLGGEVLFGHKVTGLVMEGGKATGVDFVTQPAPERHVAPTVQAAAANPASQAHRHHGTGTNHGRIVGDAVVLATGHSARDVYEQLHEAGVRLEAKGFAVGFRVEHPQRIINRIQYGTEWGRTVVTGKTTTDSANLEYLQALDSGVGAPPRHTGRLPVPSYRLATDKAFDGSKNRGVYSFCMCPGGQIVPASTDPTEVCVNGMSFSRRDSQWANSALVVTVSPEDEVLAPYRETHGVLAGIAFQRDMERRAARMGGGNLTVPVQRLTDFVQQKSSTTAPSTSYRLGVKPSACHEIYPSSLTASLRSAVIEHFDKVMPGFLCEDGLLHAVETRTSSPVRVSRNDETKEAFGVDLLFPSGEGAGFAGGIVSAAVDGLVVAAAVERRLGIQPLGEPRLSNSDKISSYY